MRSFEIAFDLKERLSRCFYFDYRLDSQLSNRYSWWRPAVSYQIASVRFQFDAPIHFCEKEEKKKSLKVVTLESKLIQKKIINLTWECLSTNKNVNKWQFVPFQNKASTEEACHFCKCLSVIKKNPNPIILLSVHKSLKYEGFVLWGLWSSVQNSLAVQHCRDVKSCLKWWLNDWRKRR